VHEIGDQIDAEVPIAGDDKRDEGRHFIAGLQRMVEHLRPAELSLNRTERLKR